MTRTILVVEDETDLAYLLQRNLEAEGYDVSVASDGDAAIRLAQSAPPDLVLLDLMLPKRSGIDVLRVIRAAQPQLPVIILTARTAVAERVQGLKLGADDYIGKPFEMTELLARIQAVLRRSADQHSDAIESITLGGLYVDFLRLTAVRNATEVALSSREFKVLRALAQRRGQTVSRNELLAEAWAKDEAVTERTVDAHIKNLRKKIEPDPANPTFLRTVQREGYVLVPA